MASLRDQFIAALDRKTEPIDIPDWFSSTVYLRTWSEGEKLSIFGGIKKDSDLAALKLDARCVLMSLGDADGNRIFTDKDLDYVLAKNASIVAKVAKQAMQFNGIGQEEEIEKN